MLYRGTRNVFDIFYYRDKQGRQPIREYILELSSRKDKESRVKTKKIYEYIGYLSRVGTAAKEPYVKHIDGEIWELRPIRDRIFFAAVVEDDGKNDGFILLHFFMKKTQKTPRKEIDQAKRNLIDYRERMKENEKDTSGKNTSR
jgi:phage-related protein